MYRLLTFTLLLSLLCIGISFAQTGSIKGTVKEKDSEEPSIGTTVLIENTTIGAATNIDGKFEIKNLQAGTYTLIVSAVGYKTQRITDVVVEAGKATTIALVIEEDSEELGSVVVVAFRETDSEIAVIEEVRKSEAVANGVSAEQIEQSQDGDAAQVMTRVPGITITDNRFVIVRGVADRYNNVLINNAIAPSTEIDVRTFSFDLIPSHVIDRLLVYKSGSPEMPGDFAGGMIKVFTKNSVEENATTFSVGTGYRMGTTFQPFVKTQNSPTDFLGFDNGFRSLPNNFPSTADLQNSSRASELREMAGKSLNNTFENFQGTAMPDISLGVGLARKFEVGKLKVSNITTLNYSKSYQYKMVDRYRYFFFNPDAPIERRFFYEDDSYAQTARLGLLSNWRVEVNPKTTIEFRNMLSQIGENENTIRNGFDYLQRPNDDLRNYSYHYLSRTIYTGQLQGSHNLKDDKHNLTWVVGLNYLSRNEPDYRRFRTFRDTVERETNAPFTMQLPPSANLFDTGRFFSKLTEVGVSQGLTYTINFGKEDEDSESNTPDSKKPTLRFGYQGEYRQREFDARYVSYLFPGFFDQAIGEQIRRLPIDQIFAPENISRDNGLVIEEGTRPTDRYTGTNLLVAGFVGGNLPLGDLNLAGGLRIEYNDQVLLSRDDFSEVRGGKAILSPLPFLNATYDLNKKSLLRLAYSRTVNRPDFRELAPFVYYNFELESGVRGNPDLDIAKIHNVDARFEFYPNMGEVFSLGVFYKYFQTPIESFLQVTTEQPQFTYQNADNARSFGVEMELRKSFADITSTPILRNMSLVVNASLINSRVDMGASATAQDQIRPLQGQSPYVVNTALYYRDENTKTSFNIAYNIIGARIFAVGDVNFPTIYELPRHAIDLTFMKEISTDLNLKIGVQDLLNYRYRFYQDSNLDAKITKIDAPIFTFRRGTLFNCSLSYRLKSKN
jgi:outer membrane cobalamin receptor